jgi:hypothetical protein
MMFFQFDTDLHQVLEEHAKDNREGCSATVAPAATATANIQQVSTTVNYLETSEGSIS